MAYPSGVPAPHEGSVPVSGASLYVRDIGPGQPIIVLHGGPSFDHKYLLPDLDRLADVSRLIYYDQRGRGKSAENVRPEDVNLQSELDDLESVRAFFQLDSIALLGHSWGTLLALEYALRHPEHVSHLILLNPAPVSYDDCKLFVQYRDAMVPEDTELLRVLESRPELEEGDLETRAAYYRIYFRRTLRASELLERLIEHLEAGWTKEDVIRARAIGDRLWGETYDSSGYNLLPQLTRLRLSTLILRGDYDFIPLPCAAHIAEAISGARLVELSDCGHFSYMERPVEVHTALNKFIQAG